MSSQNIPKLELNLNEENELNFSVSFEGSVTDSDMSSPIFRFIMTEVIEKSTEPPKMSWLFPGKKLAENVISVKIPASLKEGIAVNKKYHGKLEAIMGPLYFAPTEVMLEFKQPFKIEATAITVKKKPLTSMADSGGVSVKSNIIDNKPSANKTIIESNKKEIATTKNDIEKEEIDSIILFETVPKECLPDPPGCPRKASNQKKVATPYPKEEGLKKPDESSQRKALLQAKFKSLLESALLSRTVK